MKKKIDEAKQRALEHVAYATATEKRIKKIRRALFFA